MLWARSLWSSYLEYPFLQHHRYILDADNQGSTNYQLVAHHSQKLCERVRQKIRTGKCPSTPGGAMVSWAEPPGALDLHGAHCRGEHCHQQGCEDQDPDVQPELRCQGEAIFVRIRVLNVPLLLVQPQHSELAERSKIKTQWGHIKRDRVQLSYLTAKASMKEKGSWC